MADKTLEVRIRAQDGASAIFAKVGDSAQTMGQAIEKAGTTGVQSFRTQIKAMESEISTVGKVMAGIGGGLTAALAIPFAAGTKAAWSQVDAVQKATVALRAYEQDASKVNETLKELVSYARSDEGVLFQRQDLFAAAQGLKVAGAETQNLTEYVKVMSRAVAVGMTNWGELTQVIQRVGATGKLAGYDFDMLTKAGFQLDTSLRNQSVSWSQLFSVLDRGIPQIGDNLNTIQGLTIRFMSALRSLGMEILKVDADTSQFIAGGLGDRLYHGLEQGASLMKSMAGAASFLGDILSGVAGTVSFFVDGFLALPSAVQTGIFVFSGLTGGTMALGSSLLLLLPRILATKAAFDTLAGSSTILSMIGRTGAAAFGPWGLAIAGVTTAVIAGASAWGVYKKHVDEVDAAIKGLTDAWADTDSLIARLPDNVATTVRGQFDAVQGIIADFTTEAQSFKIELTDIFSTPDENSGRRLSDSISDMLDTHVGQAFKQWVSENSDIVGDELFGALLDRKHLDLYAPEIEQAWDQFINDTFVMTPAQRTTLEKQMQGFWFEALKPGIDEGKAREAWDSIIGEFMRVGDVDLLGDRIASATSDIVSGKYTTAYGEALKAIDDAYAHPEEVFDRLDALFEESAEKREKLNAEIVESARKAAGFDDALSQMAMRSNASDAALLANNITDVGTAMDTAFRAVVGNTNAIKSQADSIKSWADELIGAQGEWSRLDELVGKGLITGESGVFGDDSQYARAQEAYNSIAVSTASIHDNIDAIQAVQSPLIADLLEKQATYIGQLRTQDEQTQLIALGWMDATTAGRAFEIQQLAIEAASAGATQQTKDAFTAYVTGAAAADPVLASLLESMDLISMGTDGTITVNLDGVEQAQSDVDNLNRTVGDLIDVLDDGSLNGSYTVNIDADTSGVDDALRRFDEDPDGYGLPPVKVPVELDFSSVGAGVGGTVAGAAGGAMQDFWNGAGWKVGVSADTSQAEADVAALQGVVEATDVTIHVSTVGTIQAITDLAFVKTAAELVPDEAHIDVAALYWDTVVGDLGRVKDATNDIPDTAYITVGTIGAESAIGLLHAVANAANAIPDSVSTTITTNLVTNIQTNRIPGNRHGGIAGYAHGGVIAELAEAGPELLHFANGGTMPVWDRGLYSVPPGTYVSPSNTNTANYGGTSVVIENITVHGDNAAEIHRVLTDEFTPSLIRVINDQRAGQVR